MSDDELRIVGDYLWDRTYARTVDRLSSERFHIAPEILMENAGKALAEVILEAGVEDEPVVVLAGHGNNGGDALVAARYLAEAGAAIHVYLVGRSDGTPSALCERQLKILRALGHDILPYKPGLLKIFLKHEPLVIDGILGLGFEGPLDEDSLAYKALREASTLHDSTVVAVDVPSGLDGDSGDAQEIPLPADVTVTFGGKKPAHVLSPARDLCGDVLSIDIGFPHAAQDEALNVHKPSLVLPDPKELVRNDPWAELSRSANKYDRGHVLVIGGSAGKVGAPIMAGMAALRAGAGWVSIAMPRSALESLKGDVPRELTFEPLFDGDQLNPINLQRFLEERKVKAVVCGPGFMESGLDLEALAALVEFTNEGDGFVVLDAGATQGIALLLESLSELKAEPEKWLLTPHPGEWRKLGREFDVTPLSPSGLKTARDRAEKLGVTLLFKGATPLLVTGNPSMPGFVSNEGSVILARAGSGDVLAGVIGAHGAVGLSSVTAALRAQAVVAWAAALAADEVGENAVLARDIIHHLGKVSSLLEADEDDDEDEEDDDGRH